VIDGTALIESVLVAGTAPSETDEYGDGVVGEGAAAVLTLRGSAVGENARAGAATFGATIELEASALSCNAFDLAGEDAFTLADLGGNACGCPLAPDGCKAQSASLTPPGPVEE
jgi:hypothetical protein